MPFQKGKSASPETYRARLTPWTRALLDRLVLGPALFEVAMDEAARVVPPGRAYRRFTRVQERRIVDRSRMSGDEEAMIESGQRWIVGDSVHSMEVTGTVRRYLLDGKEYIEITEAGKRRLGIEEVVHDGRAGDSQAD